MNIYRLRLIVNAENKKIRPKLNVNYSSSSNNNSLQNSLSFVSEIATNQASESQIKESDFFSHNNLSILFLSKRGITRGPLASVIMRKLLYESDYFGSIFSTARGISDVYDRSLFDQKMVQRANLQGYEFLGHARRVNVNELSVATLVISLDEESEEYTQKRKFYIRGKVLPIAKFLRSINLQYIPDPFDSEYLSTEELFYDQIIEITKEACSEIESSLSAIIF